MFNNRCVRTRPKLHLNELFSCPHLPLVSCFSQPLLPLPLCLIFCQLRNSHVGSILQKPSKYKLSYPAPQGAVIIFPFFPSPALICVPTHVKLKPPTDFRNFSFLFYVPYVILSPTFSVLCGMCFSFVFQHQYDRRSLTHSCTHSCLSPVWHVAFLYMAGQKAYFLNDFQRIVFRKIT